MLDSHPSENRDATLSAVRRFFIDYGHELADAAALLGGAPAEAKVIACGLHVWAAAHIDGRIRRDLTALHRLLALEDVGDPDRIETELFSMIDPASPKVETICILTDRMSELLRAIDDGPERRNRAASHNNRTLAA
ncbi:hypothetical protein [Pararhodobacter sp. SW119]|uniref:hypothetical protein n=1 Tax=Pararhodobacter sp. SW119 TaxID=2780075 RepID=UPI001ADFEE9B|nr:hypothetical protein [Pararhodobacter sp. SW119]